MLFFSPDVCCMQNLLRKKAAEELKKEQERKAEQRRKIIAERIGQPKPLDNCNEGELRLLTAFLC